MTTLTSSQFPRPALTVPGDLENQTRLSIYDGFPPGMDWPTEVLSRARVCSTSSELAALEFLTPLALGAPIGDFVAQSYRVARTAGIVTEISDAQSDSEICIGGCVAQGFCHAIWRNTAGANFLVVQFNAPTAFGWGAGKSVLSQEHLKARCMQQYAHQAHSLLENLADCALATAVIPEFVGEWGPESEYVRRGLSTTCLMFWNAQVSANSLRECEPLPLAA
jgi:hypothetical protein